MADSVETMTAMHTLAQSVPRQLGHLHDLLIHDGELYRVIVERIPHYRAQQALAEFIEEQAHGQD